MLETEADQGNMFYQMIQHGRRMVMYLMKRYLSAKMVEHYHGIVKLIKYLCKQMVVINAMCILI